jgi:hypothetical protein
MKTRRWTLTLLGLLLLFPGGRAAADAPAAKANRLTKVLKVWAFEKDMGAASKVKGVFKKDASTIRVRCGFENLSKKEIRASRGVLRFSTFFGETLFDLSWEAVTPIPPQGTASMEWKVKRGHFPDKEAFLRFRKTPLEEMRQVWSPSVVVFADGTSLKP